MRELVRITICGFLFFTYHVDAQSIRQERYLINGTIKGVDSGSIRMLSENGDIVLDSSVVIKGKFMMQGMIGLPERRLFSIIPGNWSFKAFVEDTIITLSIDTAGAQHYGHGGNQWALIWEIKEKGSKLADVYNKYNNDPKIRHNISVFSSLREKLKSTKGNTSLAFNIGQDIDSLVKLILSDQKTWIENYILLYPSSVAGVYLFYEFYNSPSSDISLAYLQATLDKFSGLTKVSVYYKQLTEIAAHLDHIQANSVAPDFTLLKSDKIKFTLSTIRGGYTLIDFWASWCAPCRRAIPNWKEVYAKYHQKGFNIVSVSTDKYWNDWKKALEKEQMPWIQVIEEFPNKNSSGLVSGLYEVKALPFYVLLDKKGSVMLTSGNEDIVIKKIEEVIQ